MTNKIKKISLITIVLLVFLACFSFSYAVDAEEIFDSIGTVAVEGVSGLLLLGIQQGAALLFGALNLLTGFITGVASDNSGAYGTMGDVIFNRCGLTSANFFPGVWVEPEGRSFGDTMQTFVTNVSTFYVIIRNLSVAILLGVLLYIGIRMAISTVASDEAKYKKMLYDWTVSLVLVFMLHFIIIITFYINNQLVAILSKFDPSSGFDMMALFAQAMIPGAGLDELIVFGALTIANLAMVLIYVKRTIVLGFLIMIAPLITITYAIDKIGDNKSQALNTWLREFVFSVIIQPFHCIIYIVFYGATVGTVAGWGDGFELGKLIFAAASALFMLKAEDIVKKIFGIQPSGIGNAIGAGAMALTAATSLFKGKGDKIDKSKGTMPKMKNNVETTDEKDGKDKEKEKEKKAKDSAKTDKDKSGDSGKSDDSGKSGGSGDDSSDVIIPSDGGDSGSSGGSGGSGGSDGSGGDGSSGGSDSAENKGKIKKAASAVGNAATASARFVGKGLKNAFMLTQGGEKAYNRKGGFEGYLGRKISGAATLAGLIAGGSVGTIKDAVSVGTAAGTVASSQYDKIEYERTRSKLENNEEVFAGAYNDFAEAYRAEHGDVDDSEIRSAARKIYDGNGQNLENEYERDFYSQMEQLATGGEIMGYKDGYDYVNETMRKVQEEIITPNSKYKKKDYGAKTE